jgi:hypothetical protein
MFNSHTNIEKWKSILEHPEAPAIKDAHRKAVTAQLLENTEVESRKQAAALSNFITEDTGTVAASADKGDPVLISLVRRAMPSLIAYDVCGVQPMTGPTGLIFAMKARYNEPDSTGGAIPVDTTDTEALFNVADDTFTGDGAGAGAATGSAEGDITANMGFTIEKCTVTAKTRALKAEYTMELAQDLKAVHGLDAESELANILSQEILSEINREIIGELDNAAKPGAQQTGLSTAGIFDLAIDADGRWAVEKFQALLFQLDVEANTIFSQTRRGKGNLAIVHADVASALAATGKLDSTGVGSNVTSDYGQNTLVGSVGNMKIYVDPYASAGVVNVGYRGSNPYDAGFFYAPYVPLTMVKAVGEENFQPRIAFKTRYGIAHNPLVAGTVATGASAGDDNPYYRRFVVENINVAGGS